MRDLLRRVKSGKATSQELASAIALLGKAGSLARTGAKGGGGDEWVQMAITMDPTEWEALKASIEVMRRKRWPLATGADDASVG